MIVSLKTILRCLWLLLLLYTLLRIVFFGLYFFNEKLSALELAEAFYWGLRMDITALFYTNLVFIVVYFFLHRYLQNKRVRIVALSLLLLSNLPFLAVNIIDLAYYRFNLRRTSSDILQVAAGSMDALTSFWNYYWYLFLFFVAIVFICIFFFFRWLKDSSATEKSSKPSSNLGTFFQATAFLFFWGAVARGGDSRPIMPSTALLYLPPKVQPLVNNSTITIVYSLFKRQSYLRVKQYFPIKKLDSLCKIKKQYFYDEPFQEKNVMIFILESFAQDYLDSANRWRASTPFIDSLMKRSIVCTNGFANGTESNKGLASLLGSIPPFLDEPFYSSIYSNNRIDGIGSLLKRKGYSTHFMMGTEFDHFGFAKLGKIVGIDDYITEDDYGNKKHYDGNWGIYDHYFLPFAAEKVKDFPKPFFACLFNISSHFPYTIPDSLTARFSIKGQEQAQNSISYLDYSLSLFFDKIKKESWYNNTLFVFVADHGKGWYTSHETSLHNFFRIPIFFYEPLKFEYRPVNRICQQVDVVPTILDLLRYDSAFLSFGNSVLDSAAPGYTFNRFNGVYQLISSKHVLGYDDVGDSVKYWYNYETDSLLSKNLMLNAKLKDSTSLHQMRQYIRAVIQQHNSGMVKNRFMIR